ncbi:putative nucleotidyltransferase protein [Ensifer adhaerens OV14]|nr:putative nucleotidyltransferase protein [Ensifer adhaerens OV14]
MPNAALGGEKDVNEGLRHGAILGSLSTLSALVEARNLSLAAFELHQSLEQAYATLLLVLTNYSPASHDLKFLRGLAEEQHRELAEIWPRDQQRFTAWFNILNEAYVKARYSRHYEITEEALVWLLGRTEVLINLVDKACHTYLETLKSRTEDPAISDE